MTASSTENQEKKEPKTETIVMKIFGKMNKVKKEKIFEENKKKQIYDSWEEVEFLGKEEFETSKKFINF